MRAVGILFGNTVPASVGSEMGSFFMWCKCFITVSVRTYLCKVGFVVPDLVVCPCRVWTDIGNSDETYPWLAEDSEYIHRSG